jgi:predicted component of type VI protein secretion system
MAMVTVSLGDQTLGSHTIAHYPFIVGRDPESDIHIDNIGVSRQHCKFLWADGAYHVQDLKSSNGTQINGEKVEKGALKDGDEIRLGKYKLMFHQADGEPPPPEKGQKGMADMLKDAVEEKPAPLAADGMKTFQMSADLIRAQAGVAASTSGQRAGDLAQSMDKEKGGGNKGLLFGLIGAGVVVVVLVVVIIVLLSGK